MENCKLFPGNVQLDSSPKRSNESEFEFFCRYDSSDMEEARNRLNEWFRVWPQQRQQEVKQRLCGEKANWYGACFELFLYHKLTSLGCTVEVEPHLANGRTPDFLVKHEEKRCYIEALVLADDEWQTDAEADLVEKLNSYSSTDFFLSIFSTSRLTQRIRKKQLQPIVDWMNSQDVIVVEAPENGECCKEFILQPDGSDAYTLEVSLIPVIPEFRTAEEASSRALVGIPSLGGADSYPVDGDLRERIREKRKRYDTSVLDAPLLIAVNTIAHVPHMDWALFGTPTADLRVDKRTREIVDVSESVKKDGIWLISKDGKDRLRASHLLGVWNFVLAHPSNPNPAACLYTNPYVDWSAVKNLPSPVFLGHYTQVTDERNLKYVEGA